jgi:hypothetical protein
MTAPSYANALVLLCGTILAPGRRTVAAALRVLGREHEPNFGKYHRFFSRADWSPLLLSRLLLGLLIASFIGEGGLLVLIGDDTLERRFGRQIAYRGIFRDPVRSSAGHPVAAWGIRWLCFSLLVEVPWSSRAWALPFLVVPVLSEATCGRLGKRHRSPAEWAALLIGKVSRWFPEYGIVLVGDGGYAVVSLVRQCQGLPRPVRHVARLRLDAVLHDFPAPQPKSKRGRKPKKGPRQPNLHQRLLDPQTLWRTVSVRWYGEKSKTVALASGVSLWYRTGQDPVPIRWVLVRSPEEQEQPIQAGACFCSDPEVAAEAILGWFVSRWNIEVTFEELRAQLGFETQRQWKTRAIGRTTPCLFGVFSLVVVIAKRLHPVELPLLQSRWYRKEEASFADALAAVRRHLWQTAWRSENCANSSPPTECVQIPLAFFNRLQSLACYAA